MNIFGSVSGVVSIQSGVAGVPIQLRVGTPGTASEFGKADIMRAIMTGIGVAGQGGQQFAHSLRDFIYVYTFGERIGDLTISGLGFSGICTSTERSGLDKVFEYYETNRLSNSGAPIEIALGVATTLKGVLVGFTYQLNDTQTNIGQFALQFKYPPRNSLSQPLSGQ